MNAARFRAAWSEIRRVGGAGVFWYAAACAVLLTAAAALRFWMLPEYYLYSDEAIAANNASGSLADVIDNTRRRNSSPILYPLALWAVQLVERSAFSIRVMPAAASVLTVAALLVLLPRAGVGRWAAGTAALLAALSVEAIRHAQGAREYSIDTLLAVLMIAGLFQWLRDGRKALLSASLCIAPLLQYGLVLFGAVVMAAAVICAPPKASGRGHAPSRGAIWSWLMRRAPLVWPGIFFLVGCAVSFEVTLRHQWQEGGFNSGIYLSPYYYKGGWDAAAFLQFTVGRIWELLTYHMPLVVAASMVGLLAVLLLTDGVQRLGSRIRQTARTGLGVQTVCGVDGSVGANSVIWLLFLLSMAMAAAAAALGVYPLGGIRQNIFLGPIVFLAAGAAVHSIAGRLSSFTRRTRLAPSALAVSVGVIVVTGAADVRSYYADVRPDNIDAILTVIQERAQDDDIVYSHLDLLPRLMFSGKAVDNYHYTTSSCTTNHIEGCDREMTEDPISIVEESNKRLWVITFWDLRPWERFQADREAEERVFIEPIVDRSAGSHYLHLMTPAAQVFDRYASGEPVVRSTFDLYVKGNTLVYVKSPCVLADTKAGFFLHAAPVDISDLPDDRRRHGFVNLDFDRRGMMFDGACMVLATLPKYPVASIVTGQFQATGRRPAWQAELPLITSAAQAFDRRASDESAVRSTFDVYLQGKTLRYVKAPCTLADTTTFFFLHVAPVDVSDLPVDRRRHGFDNLDFGFGRDGMIFDGKCTVPVTLPEYPIVSIRTGQFAGEDLVWQAELPLAP